MTLGVRASTYELGEGADTIQSIRVPDREICKYKGKKSYALEERRKSQKNLILKSEEWLERK